mgnify:CR=1 FL=1
MLTGAVCNNNCVFCMEEDRDARYVTNSATTDDVVHGTSLSNGQTSGTMQSWRRPFELTAVSLRKVRARKSISTTPEG